MSGVTLQVWEHEDEHAAVSKRWEEQGCCKIGIACSSRNAYVFLMRSSIAGKFFSKVSSMTLLPDMPQEPPQSLRPVQ